jgi:predicted outer membrane protein
MRLQRENRTSLFPVLSDFFETDKWVSTDKVIRNFQNLLPANHIEKQFIVDAAELNLEKIKLGQETQKNSVMPNVRALGRIMEKVYTECWNDLIILINKKSISIPTLPSYNVTDAYKKSNDISEPDFDIVYCGMIVNGYRETIALFEEAYRETADTDISALITAILPKLRKHLGYSIIVQKECETTNIYK